MMNCYVVSLVLALFSIPGVDSDRVQLGTRPIVEQLLQDNGYPLCDDGSGVEVRILEVKSPTKGIQIGPFKIKQKKTIVVTEITIDGKKFYGEGVAKTSARSTITQLKDETLPLNETAFSVALKESLVDALLSYLY